jgi:hypothetical protein
MNEIVHNYNRYRKHGCRCDTCRASNAQRRNHYRPKSDSVKIRFDAAPLLQKIEEAGDQLNVGRKQLATWREEGIDLYAADRWCIRLGYHPTQIFGHAFHQGCFDNEMSNG